MQVYNSIFDKKTGRYFETISKEKARLRDKEARAVTAFKNTVSREDVYKVLDASERYGHPDEQKLSRELRNKYDSGIGLDFDDIMTLEALYKSNYEHCNNKEGYDE